MRSLTLCRRRSRVARSGVAGLVVAAVLMLAAPVAKAQDLARASATARVRFTQVRSVVELSDHEVLVTDFAENRILRVDWETTAEGVIGRTGDGPREYRRASYLYKVAPDTVAHVDEFNGRWTALASGDLIAYRGSANSIEGVLGSHVAGTDSLGRIVGLLPLDGRYVGSVDSVAVILGNRGGATWDTIARIKGRGSHAAELRELPRMPNGMRAITSGNPLDAQDRVAMSPDGWVTVAYARGYRVDWRSPEGVWNRGALLPFDAVPVDERLKCQWSRRVAPYAERCDPTWVIGWPDVVPPFLADLRYRSLLASWNGTAVIERTFADGDTVRRYDVVDRTGALVRTVTMGEDQRIVGFGAGVIYVTTTGDMDLQTLSKHPWH